MMNIQTCYHENMHHPANHPKTIITGGTGRLGKELTRHYPQAFAPTRNQMDITDPSDVKAVLNAIKPNLIIHAAAYTNVLEAEREPQRAWITNVEGTKNLVQAASPDTRIIFFSTDYVFDGVIGDYRETDRTGPYVNQYAASKGVAELHALMHPNTLVIRTSFRASPWPHPTAYDDHWTTQEYLPDILPELLHAIDHHHRIPHRILHVAGEKKTAYALALRTRRDVGRVSLRDAPVRVPRDASLDSGLWASIKETLPANRWLRRDDRRP